MISISSRSKRQKRLSLGPRALAPLLLTALLHAGCATPTTVAPSFEVEVNSLAGPGAAERKTFLLLPGNKDTEADDLQFREFAVYVSRVLEGRGFVAADDAAQADLAVVVTYGIGDPQVSQQTYLLPIWGQTGIGSAYTSGTVRHIGNTSTVAATTTYTPTYGVTGYATQVRSSTSFVRYASLTGYDLKLFKETNRQQQLWSTTITSTGASSDLRRVFPVLMGAASVYVARDTGRRLSLTLFENENRVKWVKGLPQE